LEIDLLNPALPLGLPPGTLFHPTFLYEALWNLLGAAVIIWVGRRFSLQWGRSFAVYLVWYGIGRIAIETIRLDPSESFLGVRINVWGAVAAVVLGVIIFFVQGRRHPGFEPSGYRPGYVSPSLKGLESGDTYTAEELAGEAESAVSRPGATSPSR
jgi:hypothetical protein